MNLNMGKHIIQRGYGMKSGVFIVFLLVMLLFSGLSFAVVEQIPFLNSYNDTTPYDYNLSDIWLIKTGGSGYISPDVWHYFEVNQSKVMKPSDTTIEMTLYGAYDASHMSHTFTVLINDTWRYTNQTPIGTDYNIGTAPVTWPSGDNTPTAMLNTNLPQLFDWLYRYGHVSLKMMTYSTGVYTRVMYGSGSGSRPYFKVNVSDNDYFTNRITVSNPYEYVCFDLESGTYSTSDSYDSCITPYSDFYWTKSLNRVTSYSQATDGSYQYGASGNVNNDLKGVGCSLFAGYYVFAHYYAATADEGSNQYYIYCFNQTYAHGGRQFYGAVKFVKATDSNLTFYYSLYNGVEIFEIDSFMLMPSGVVYSGNPLNFLWATSAFADSRIYYSYRPNSNATWSSWVSVYNATPDTFHSLVLGGSYVYYGYQYRYFAYSVSGNQTATSDIYYFNVTAVGNTTTTTTTTIPVSECDSAQLGLVKVSDSNPALDQDVTIKVYVTNNGSYPCDYYIGLSVGNATSVCNHDCYVDCSGDSVNCSYARTGIVHQGTTTYIERTFRMRSEFFDANNNYSLYTAAYGQPYLPAEEALDYFTVPERFHIPTFGVKGVMAYATSAVAVPELTVKDGEVKVRSYVLNNGTTTFAFKLGMSIGVWLNVNDSQIYPIDQNWDIPPCNHECYTDGLGDWVNLTIPAGFTAPFERRFKIPDYFLEDNYFDAVVGVYIQDTLISYVYFKNISYVQEAETAVSVPDILEISGMFLGSATGTGTLSGMLLVIFIIVITVGTLIAKYTGHVEMGLAAMGVLTIVFTVIESGKGVIPIWIPIIVVIIVLILASRMFGQLFGGGK
jgi:hypothetical protein